MTFTLRVRATAALVCLPLSLPLVLLPMPASARPADPEGGRAATAGSPAAVTGVAGTAVPGRYLVRYTKGVDVSAMARSLRVGGLAVGRTYSHAVRGAVVTATAAEAAALAARPSVAAVEPDTRISLADTAGSWGLDRIDQHTLPLDATYARVGLDGAGVDAYILDTGVLSGHVDFGGRVATGWTPLQDGGGTEDCNGHGTHVAGITAGNRYGVAGRASIVPVRIMDCAGDGYMSDLVAGLDWVAARHVAGTPAVVNLSLGGPGSDIADAALRGVINDGVTVAVAAGNSAVDACTQSPGRVAGALTVAASDRDDRQASFSNHGSCVDLYAPGVAVVSDWNTSSTAAGALSGTSMASPHVAGAAAVLLSNERSLTPAGVADRLVGSASTDVLSGVTVGTVNRLLFLAGPDEPGPAESQPEAAATPEPVSAPPTAPVLLDPVQEPVVAAPGTARRVAARPRTRRILVTWVRGAAGSSPLTRQSVIAYAHGKKVRTLTVGPRATRVLVGHLRRRTGYTFRVVARSAAGSGDRSARSNFARLR